jgi:HEPN domain-containing protein
MIGHEGWSNKARHDFSSARILFGSNPLLLDTAVYHAQRCGEKALNGSPAYHNRPVEKNHTGEGLAELCPGIEKNSADIFEDAVFLTPFSTAFRYPEDIPEPEAQGVRDAVFRAEIKLVFVENNCLII